MRDTHLAVVLGAALAVVDEVKRQNPDAFPSDADEIERLRAALREIVELLK